MSFISKLISSIKDVAPAVAEVGLAGVAGGPGGALLALARKVAGAGAEADPEQAAEAIINDPEKLMEFRKEARKMELRELELRTLDVQDARKTLSVSKGPIVISMVVVFAYFVCTLIVMTKTLPTGSENLAYLLLGNLGTGFGMVLTFWLGSSVGSKDKTTALAQYSAAAADSKKGRS